MEGVAKLLLVVALREQEEDCLAREVLEGQVGMGWPVLAQEAQEICQEIGLPDVTNSKNRVEKENVKEAIKMNHLMKLKEQMTGTKLESMK